MASAITQRVARYISVGAVCAVVHNLIMTAGDFSGYNYACMAFISFFVVTPLAYRLHVSFTFDSTFSFRGMMRYAAVSLTGFAVFFVLLGVLCSGFGMRSALATPILTLIFFFWNYASAHWAIYEGPAHQHFPST